MKNSSLQNELVNLLGERCSFAESTRLNQIRFYNQVINNESNLTTDGLSTLKYTKVSSISQGKYSFISVKL